MKALAKILLWGLVAFLTLTIAQEWPYFSSAWFGKPESSPSLARDDEASAIESVRLTLTLMRHLYLSGGDSRFAERIPADEGVVQEMMADIHYLGRNQRIQDLELLRFDVTGFELLGRDRVEIRTRESWRLSILWMHGGRPAQPSETQTIQARYLVVREGPGWRVAGWETTGGEDPGTAGPA